MDAVQAITGSGGWPLNVFLTSDGKPFYGGTYFPARSLLALLDELAALYHRNPDKVFALSLIHI